MVKVFLRTAYNYDMNAASDESALVCLDPTMAQQSAKDECDINTIVKRFGLTGQLPSGVRMPSYGDFTGLSDFQSALDAVRSAAESFQEMPADVRSRFQNDPALFVDFCSRLENRAEAIKLGLVPPDPPPPVPEIGPVGGDQAGGGYPPCLMSPSGPISGLVGFW